MFPIYLRDDGMGNGGDMTRRANLSGASQRYLDHLGASVEDLFHHVLAVLHDPAYREANAGALRMEWPRIPLPGWSGGDGDGASEALAMSAARGRELATLLDPETPVPSVTEPPLRPEIAAIAVPATTDGRNMAGDDFALTAGWGHHGAGDAVMPGQGRVVEASLYARRTYHSGRRHIHTWRDHFRHLSQHPRFLAKRPRRRLDLQARRLPGAQEMALVPRTLRPRPSALARGSPALHRHRPPGRNHLGDCIIRCSRTRTIACRMTRTI